MDKHREGLNEVIASLGEAASQAAIQARLSGWKRRPTPELMDRLYDEVVRLVRVDLAQARRVARAARWLAQAWKDEYALAQASRALGHVDYLSGLCAEALAHYQSAIGRFEKLGRPLDLARTLSGSLQSLIYLGDYGRAFDWATRARSIFAAEGDGLRLARLDLNLGNILYRQDRFEESLRLYRRALRYFRGKGESQDRAVALRNIAVAHMGLHQMVQAQRAFRQARRVAHEGGLPALVAEADYNIAYLHYLRGEFNVALDLYNRTQEFARHSGDAYHRAICSLDQSDLYLELNLIEEAGRLAREAADGFASLGVAYERGKALLNLATAESRGGRTAEALDLLGQGRSVFDQEKNAVWGAIALLYRAQILADAGQPVEAENTAREALQGLDHSNWASRKAQALLLLARLQLERGDIGGADLRSWGALECAAKIESPSLLFQTHALRGKIAEESGDPPAARRQYLRARGYLERLRSRLTQERLTLAFIRDKLLVYDRLIALALRSRRRNWKAEAFQLIGEMKSRVLADVLALRDAQRQPAGGALPAAARRFRNLRSELNWLYRELDISENRETPLSADARKDLLARTRSLEARLAEAAPGGPDAQQSGQFTSQSLDLNRFQASLPQDVLFLEYFAVGGALHLCAIDRRAARFLPLGPLDEVRHVVRLLQLQLSKLQLGPGFAARYGRTLQASADLHLERLHELLLGPLTVAGRYHHLVVAPSGALNSVPFHALRHKGGYLIDSTTVSYAPSAGVYEWSLRQPPAAGESSLVFGISDASAPEIAAEAEAVGRLLPRSRLYLNERATESTLRRAAPRSRFIHIATHGHFRQDNPMFSSIRLGDSRLSLWDLYGFRLQAALVTLSGCSTGLSVSAGGDEMIGLIRGLLFAGTRTVQSTLWDVHDRSTACYMTLFYRNLLSGTSLADAQRSAMLDLRPEFPHPFFWAPFALTGAVTPDRKILPHNDVRSVFSTGLDSHNGWEGLKEQC